MKEVEAAQCVMCDVWCVMGTQMLYQQSKRDELGGSGMGHYVISEWWSQRGIKMFQTNITPMHSAGVMHRAVVCACLPMLLSKWGRAMRECCASVFWVCLWCECEEWVVSESVVPACHGLQGLWVCEWRSSSPPLSVLPLLSWVQLNTCSFRSRHRAGQGFLSNWRQRQYLIQSLFTSLPLLPSLWLASFNPKLKTRKWKVQIINHIHYSCIWTLCLNAFRHSKCLTPPVWTVCFTATEQSGQSLKERLCIDCCYSIARFPVSFLFVCCVPCFFLTIPGFLTM